MYTIEEYPPQREPDREPGTQSPANGTPTRSTTRRIVSIAIAVVAVAGMGFGGAWWLMDRRLAELEGELTMARTSLDAAQSSLQLLWATTSRLDAAQGQRNDFLRDSIGSVKTFVDSAVSRLWQAAYLDHESRLDQNVRRLTAHDQAIADLLAGARNAGTRIDVLYDESSRQSADLQRIDQILMPVQQSLTTLTGQVGDLESEVTLARTGRAQTDLRLDGVERWAVSFREFGLSGRVVQERLANLDEGMRTTSSRVDSLVVVTDSLGRLGVPARVGTIPPGG